MPYLWLHTNLVTQATPKLFTLIFLLLPFSSNKPNPCVYLVYVQTRKNWIIEEEGIGLLVLLGAKLSHVISCFSQHLDCKFHEYKSGIFLPLKLSWELCKFTTLTIVLSFYEEIYDKYLKIWIVCCKLIQFNEFSFILA